MRDHDEDLERIRTEVSCAAVLEALRPGWALDKRESTRRCRKYRAGPGRILIVSHQGRGWWDPLSPAKGDVFDLLRHLDPGLGFGGACDVLRAFVGLGSSDPPAAGPRHRCQGPAPTLAERWAARRPMAPGSPAWRYLAQERGRCARKRRRPRASCCDQQHYAARRLAGPNPSGPGKAFRRPRKALVRPRAAPDGADLPGSGPRHNPRHPTHDTGDRHAHEAVTTHDISCACFLLEQVLAALLDADPQTRDDALLLDMLDGWGGNAIDLLRALAWTRIHKPAPARGASASSGPMSAGS